MDPQNIEIVASLMIASIAQQNQDQPAHIALNQLYPHLVDGSNIPCQCFQVSRQHVDDLIADRGAQGTAMLLHRIMQITKTIIHWPHSSDESQAHLSVWVFGTPANNAWARSLTLGMFATRGNLIKMTLGMSQWDQVIISGQTGAAVSSIMQSTNTQIMFGDPDPSNVVGSHKVVVYGGLESLQQAREALRNQMPYIIRFDMHLTRRTPDLRSFPKMHQLATESNVRFVFHPTAVKSVYRVVVQGLAQHAQMMQEAVDEIFADGTVMRPVFRLELCVPSDVVEIYTKDDILRTVKANTNVEIDYVEGEFSKLIISGPISDVHRARQELIGYMPVELKFQLYNCQQLNNCMDEILDLANKYTIQLSIEPSANPGDCSITMRGTERYVHNIYNAYKEVLNLRTLVDILTNIAKEESALASPSEDRIDSGSNGNSSDWLLVDSGGKCIGNDFKAIDLTNHSSTPNQFDVTSSVEI